MPRKRLFHSTSLAALPALVATLVLTALPGCPGKQRAQPESPLREEGIPEVRVLVARGAELRLASTGGYAVLADGREVLRSEGRLSQATLTRAGGAFSLNAATYPAEVLTILPAQGQGRASADIPCVRVGKTYYRGRVSFHRAGRREILAVNHVDLESYLAGVLGRELYPTWQARTYQAQAIAARTYALYESFTVGRGRPYDLRDDQSSQVYGGFSAETAKAWQAVRATHGIVLAAGAEGREKLFRAHYSACCGGVSNSVYVLYGPPVTEGPLAGGRACTDCSACPRYRWAPVSVPKAVIHRAAGKCFPEVAELPAVTAVEVVETVHDRPVWLSLSGPAGRKVRIRAEDLRLALLRDGDPTAKGLYSMNCRVHDAGSYVVFDHGRGFGHGVGLCQWGAQAKAARGYSVEQILRHYYPDAKLFRAY